MLAYKLMIAFIILLLLKELFFYLDNKRIIKKHFSRTNIFTVYISYLHYLNEDKVSICNYLDCRLGIYYLSPNRSFLKIMFNLGQDYRFSRTPDSYKVLKFQSYNSFLYTLDIKSLKYHIFMIPLDKE